MVGPPAFGRKVHGTVVPCPNLDAMVAVQKELAAEFGCAYFDVAKAMGGAAGVVRWREQGPQVLLELMRLGLKPDAKLVERAKKNDLPLLGKDLIHFHSQGYQVLGDLLVEALLLEYDAYLERNR